MKLARVLPIAIALALVAPDALAQKIGGGGGGGQSGPTQSSPTRNKPVGPQRGGPDDDPTQGGPSPAARPQGEPTVQLPADPLDVPEGIKTTVGSDNAAPPAPPEGETQRSYFPYYEGRKGDYRLRMVPPLYLEHTRGLDPQTGATTANTDMERLTALLFYQRRSRNVDADILFPIAWRVRDEQTKLLVLGPFAHREAPNEHDNWLAPLYFQGKRKDGGYFHSLPLLTTSHWGEKSAFTIAGPYFRDRKLRDVDMGVVPFWFHGDNGDLDGGHKTYTIIPPALYFHREREYDESSFTVVGPVIAESNPKRSIFDVAPFFFSIHGKPETGGVKEAHYTLFPFFHYGTSPEKNLLVLPGYLRRVTPTADTLITPFFSRATTRSGSTSLTVVGPVLPIYYRNIDKDVGYDGLGIFPFYFGSSSPTGRTFLTPLYGKVESYNVTQTHWIFPNITYTRDVNGWETDLHPIIYLGRDKDSSHTVVAPIFWDFASPKGRTTVAFPLYWRFADNQGGTVTQVAGNTLYRERRVSGGTDWQFHLLPLFSYGENPSGYWWNILFGLAGYEKAADTKTLKALWLPIQIAGPEAAK